MVKKLTIAEQIARVKQQLPPVAPVRQQQAAFRQALLHALAPLYTIFDQYHQEGIMVPGRYGRGEVFASGAVVRQQVTSKDDKVPSIYYNVTPRYRLVITLVLPQMAAIATGNLDILPLVRWRCRLVDCEYNPPSTVHERILGRGLLDAVNDWFVETVAPFVIASPDAIPATDDDLPSNKEYRCITLCTDTSQQETDENAYPDT